MVRRARASQADQARRRPLCGDPARDGRHRRLADAAAERAQVLREAAAAVLDDRVGLRGVRRERMDVAAVDRADRLRRRARRRLDRGAALRPAHRPVRGDRDREQPRVRAARALQHARHGADVLHDDDVVRGAAGARRASTRVDRRCALRCGLARPIRLARLDAGRVGCARARRPVEGTGRGRAVRRGAGRLRRGVARLDDAADARRRPRPRVVRADRRSVVRRGVEGEPRLRALLLHPRARRALPHDRASPRGSVVVLRAGRRRRIAAVAVGRAGRDRLRLARSGA